MHLTPTILEAAYNYLRATPPFSKWKLPESDAVEFHVTRTQPTKAHNIIYGDYNNRPGKPRIRISHNAHKNQYMVVLTMAHEMVHMYQYQPGARGSYDHGPKFKRLAAQVCRAHGFDPETF